MATVPSTHAGASSVNCKISHAEWVKAIYEQYFLLKCECSV